MNSNQLPGMSDLYSNNSKSQDECQKLANSFLKEAAINCVSKQVNIGVFGCGPGENDLKTIQESYIPHLKFKENIKIHMIDIAETKWSKLKNIRIGNNIEIFGYKQDVNKINFYENYFDLIISFSCLHWLNKIPINRELIKDIYCWSELNDKDKNIITNYTNESLSVFLNKRFNEIKSNGYLISSFDAEKDNCNHQYQGPTDCLAKIIRKIKKENTEPIIKEILDSFFVPTAPRKLLDVVTVVNKIYFKSNLNQIYSINVKCPIWELWKNKKINDEEYAIKINDAIMSCMSPLISNKKVLNLINKELKSYFFNNIDVKNSTQGEIIIMKLVKN